MELFRKLIERELSTHGRNVILAKSLYEEIYHRDNIHKDYNYYIDICTIIVLYKLKNETIELNSIKDIEFYKKLNTSEDSRLIPITNPITDLELKASERDLRIILDALVEVKKAKNLSPSELVNQEDLITYIKHPDGRKISQSKLSRMINERKPCHIININKNPDTYKELVQSISSFRNMMREYDLKFIS